jgi:hypothetical protein
MLLSPSSTLPPPASHCASTPAGRNSAHTSRMLLLHLFYFFKLQNLKFCKPKSVCIHSETVLDTPANLTENTHTYTHTHTHTHTHTQSDNAYYSQCVDSSVSTVTMLWAAKSTNHGEGKIFFPTKYPHCFLGAPSLLLSGHWGTLLLKKTGQGMRLTTHIHLVLMLSMSGAVLTLCHMPSRHAQGLQFYSCQYLGWHIDTHYWYTLYH